MKKLTWLILFAFFLLIHQKANTQSAHLFEIGKVDSVYSKILKESREIYIQLPENYQPDGQLKYPVIYVLDGDVLLNAVSTVYSFYWGGFLPEMIIVGISNKEHRTRDLTPSKITTKYGMPFNEENGEAENFTQFIITELIPFIERNYATTDYRTLIGHSYGGLFAINMLINHNDVFDNYLAIDPSLNWDDQKLLKQSKEVFSKESFKGKSLFLSLGGILHMQKEDVTIDNVMEDTSDYTLFARSNIEFSRLARSNAQNGLRHRWKFYEQDYHGTIPLPSILDGLIYLFEWYQMEHIQEFNDPETPIEVLMEIIEYRRKKLSDHFGYAVPPYGQDLFEMLGYMHLEMGQMEKSLMFFKLNLYYYPFNANTYNSLADYHVAKKNYNSAFIDISRAYAISGKDYHKKKKEEIRIKMKKGEDIQVSYFGALKNFMKKGDISAQTDLADLKNIDHLYALGAVENLTGEILVLNSQAYITSADGEKVDIDSSFDHKAALLVYARVSEWNAVKIPSNIKTYDELEAYVSLVAIEQGIDIDKPFPFLLEGHFNMLKWHSVNWKAGDMEHSHEKHIQSGPNGTLMYQEAEILGFYSNSHHAVFTHHTTNMHLHMRAKSDQIVGHVDELRLGKNIILKLPVK